jgi:superkiller protein 3
LRSAPSDVHAWIGLGEAYANSGRHSAALKSFARAETLNPGNWYAKYILGNVQKDVLEYGLACQTFREILVDNPNEFSVSLSLAQTLLTWAYACFRTGKFSKSIDIAVEGIIVAQELVQEREELSEAWKLIGDASYLGSLVQVDGSRGLLEIAADVLDRYSDVETLLDDDCNEEGDDIKKRLLDCNVAAMEKVVTLTEGDRLAHSAAFFNLGLAKYRFATMETDVTNASSVRPILECFKKAIQSEPRNFEYWNALGVVTARSLPSVAEKAFSRSLQINERVLLLSVSLIKECNGMDKFGNHVSHTRGQRVSCTGIFTKSSE